MDDRGDEVRGTGVSDIVFELLGLGIGDQGLELDALHKDVK